MRTIFLFLNLLFLFQGCNMSEVQDPLKGRIAVYNYQSKQYSIYINSDTPSISFNLVNQFGGIYWLNSSEGFLGYENFLLGLTREEKRCDIVLFDSLGSLSERVYESKNGEFAWPLYTSRNDKYLLFTTHHLADPKKYPFEGLTPMLSLSIMDLEEKKIIHEIDSIGRSPNFKVAESPWLYSGYRFVYSIDGKTQLQLEGEEKEINPVTSSEGVYIFDLASRKKKLLVPGAHTAIASPIKDQLAYQKDNTITVLDLNTNEEKVIYEHSPKEQVLGMHWTPDGEHIYFAYKHRLGIGDRFTSGEKLININTQEEKPFKKIGHGFGIYSWR